MQKKIPIIEAHSFVCVYICVFMQEVVPLQKKSKSMDPPVNFHLNLEWVSLSQIVFSQALIEFRRGNSLLLH